MEIAIVITVALALTLFFIGIWRGNRFLDKRIAQENKPPRNTPPTPPAQTSNDEDFKAVKARIVSKRIKDYYVGGTKHPRYVVDFIITFATKEGEMKEFSLSQAFFDAVEEGQEGNLVTVNGKFFDFGQGEDIPDESE